MDTRFKRFIFEIVIYLFIGVSAFILATISGFSLQGFQESFQKGFVEVASYLGSYLIYLGFGMISFFLIIFSVMNYIFIKNGEHPATQPNPGWLRIFTVDYIYNPEDSFLGIYFGAKSNRIINNIIRVVAISVIVFGLLGILHLFFPKFAFAGVPNSLQQITPFSDVIFGSVIPAYTENGTILFIFFFLLGVDAYFCSKFIKDKKLALAVFFIIAFLIISPIIAYIWMTYHSITYGNSEASLIITFIFGLAGCWLTLVFGIAIPFLVWHFMNNFFIKLSELATIKEDLILISLIAWILFTALYIGIEVLLYKRRKKSPEINITS